MHVIAVIINNLHLGPGIDNYVNYVCLHVLAS